MLNCIYLLYFYSQLGVDVTSLIGFGPVSEVKGEHKKSFRQGFLNRS